MKNGYRPDLGGFGAHLGLRNGLEELLRQPVPQQDVIFYARNDISSETEYPRKTAQNRRGRKSRYGK